MNARRLWLIALALLALAGALTLTGRLARGAAANRERVAALHVLAGSNSDASMDQLAWDTGWSSLCQPDGQRLSSSLSTEALSFVAATRLERGDYAGALEEFRRAAAEGQGQDTVLAQAYVAALELRWLDAAQLYPGQPTPRHQRFWGTVFYLAAQELMFRGQADEAAPWYRRADQSYGVQGPYLGLALVDCLAQQGRTLEAFDAYRRGLVVLPPEEALAQRERFEQMRLEALHAWRDLDPANPQAAAWLDFYAGDRPVEEQERLAQAPQPQVALTHDLGDGRRLLGFDYRPEDIATGPFLWVDLYVQEGMAEGDPVVRLRRAVLNQAPNGSFAWDAAPDGVRPFGWHGLVYAFNLAALDPQALVPDERWQCLDAARINASFGLQGLTGLVRRSAQKYVQGGKSWINFGGALSLGRKWSTGSDGVENFSYVPGGHGKGTFEQMVGLWTGFTKAQGVAVWLLAHGKEQTIGCFTDLYLFDLALPAPSVS